MDTMDKKEFDVQQKRFAHLSDTHGHEAAFVDGFRVPDADFLLHTGDFGGPLEGDLGEWFSFLEVMARLPHKRKIMVAGNHDAAVMMDPVRCIEQAWAEAGIHLLIDSFMEENGVVFAGLNLAFPEEWTIKHGNLLHDAALHAQSRGLPLVVLSHCPPEGVLDGTKFGSAGLRRSLLSSGACAVFFGHIYESPGVAMVSADNKVRKCGGHDWEHAGTPPPEGNVPSSGYLASNGTCVDLFRTFQDGRWGTKANCRPVNRVILNFETAKK